MALDVASVVGPDGWATWVRPGDLPSSTVRAAAITALRRRSCRPRDLSHELGRRPQLRARVALAELVRLLDEGCRSELEIRGCLTVLQTPGMPAFTLQHRVEVAGRTLLPGRGVRGGEARGRDGRRRLARVPRAA